MRMLCGNFRPTACYARLGGDLSILSRKWSEIVDQHWMRLAKSVTVEGGGRWLGWRAWQKNIHSQLLTLINVEVFLAHMDGTPGPQLKPRRTAQRRPNPEYSCLTRVAKPPPPSCSSPWFKHTLCRFKYSLRLSVRYDFQLALDQNLP